MLFSLFPTSHDPNKEGCFGGSPGGSIVLWAMMDMNKRLLDSFPWKTQHLDCRVITSRDRQNLS